VGSIWQSILDAFQTALSALHSLFAPIGDEPAWGFAIIALTIIVRVLLLPLAVKQTRSMRAMQKLQPKVKKLQEKYKVDRELMRKDPETYRAKKQKLNEEMMALYREEGVNPASGCLPLLAQAPIFFALFSVLRDPTFTELQNADFYFFTSYITGEPSGLGGLVSAAGWPGWLLIVLMAGTMGWSSKQMMARTQAEGVQAQQQKIMMYVMPVFLAVISFNLPLGVLLYWVTTNLWQVGQQAVILKEVEHELEVEQGAREQSKHAKGGKSATAGGSKKGKGSATSGNTPKKPSKSDDKTNRSNGPAPRANGSEAKKSKQTKKRDHLPRRRG
jgi:YidC/Oxa1 family membrane protein insertase